MAKREKKKLFDFIAPVYGIFFPMQIKMYGFVPNFLHHLRIRPPMSILDVGCGTGALAMVLAKNHYRVTAIDPAKEMLKVALWKTRGENIRYVHMKEMGKLPFRDHEFDLVISSYVLHGMKREERLGLYREMKRVSRRKVIIHDYNQERALLTNVVEYMEKGDYFNFINVATQEMEEIFDQVKTIQTGKRACWYIMDAQGSRLLAKNTK